MALLKGGTCVDGDLYVEDSIKAHNIQDLDGKNFPYVDTAQPEGYTNRVVRFSNNESGIIPTSTSLTESSESGTVIAFPGQGSSIDNHKLQIEALSKNISVKNSGIKLNNDNSTWEFKE